MENGQVSGLWCNNFKQYFCGIQARQDLKHVKYVTPVEIRTVLNIYLYILSMPVLSAD